MKRSGTFVAIDGPNGVGKSTLLAMVADRLRRRGFSIHVTKEVTDTSIGRFIHQVHSEYRGKTLALLVAADRQNHIERDILPALETHDFVITDRYVASSLVFQRLDGVKQSYVWKLNADFARPNLTIIVTASDKTISERLSRRRSQDRFEQTFRRQQEIQLFARAASFLKRKGFRVTTFKNENISISQAADQLVAEICRLKRK
jgi:dTMP kinase